MVLGSKLCSQLTGIKDNFAREAKIVVVDIDEFEHTKKGVRIDKVVISDAAEFLSGLLGRGLQAHDRNWPDKCIHWKSVFALENEPFIKTLKDRRGIRGTDRPVFRGI